MYDALKNTNERIEGLRGKKLLTFTLGVFLVFLALGGILGYFVESYISTPTEDVPPEEVVVNTTTGKSYTGRIVFVDPNFYPEDAISYSLVGPDGEDIILLKSNDQKLIVAEGHTATVFGNLTKTFDGKEDVLVVNTIQINTNQK